MEEEMFLINTVSEDEKPEITVNLAGPQGNAFFILALVKSAWKRKEREDIAQEYLARASSGDYEHLLATTRTYSNAFFFGNDEEEDDVCKDEA
jgi:hypothetical protein